MDPFGAPAPAASNNTSTMAGNPFDPMAAAPPVHQQNLGATPATMAGYSPQKDNGAAMNGAPPSGENPFGLSTAQPPPQISVYGQPAPPSYNGNYGQPPPPASEPGAMVVAEQQSNPYGAAIVPAQQPTNQWGVAAPAPAVPSGNPFDPFAPPPPPAPAAPQYAAPPPPQEEIHQQPPPAEQQIVPATAHNPAPVAATGQPEESMNRYDPQDIPGQAVTSRNYGNVDRMNPDQNYNSGDRDAPKHVQQQREQQTAEMGRQLARTAPGASPLPKPELVRKKGFVMSRISFRTIVMKKWKQSFWVQYGPHTMLWFRSETDFNDWLNNPYHNQVQRNFLIKLAVNFVHDLYKPSVRGYQVTQCRTKPYGSKMIRQFKLERWMDYGPTIAAAFGSYNPKEVDDLRQAIVECMRNTPLNNGIRATGAVRQQTANGEDADRPRK